jgi:protein gp37
MMPKKSNMYSFVTTTRNYLAGECKHKCSYCYVNAMKDKFPNLKERYSGEIILINKELTKSEGKDKTIFVQDMGDLFEESVPKEFIQKVLTHLRGYPTNTYLFQTKNPRRYFEFINEFSPNCLFGTTIETNKQEEIDKISKAPKLVERQYWIGEVNFGKKFLTLEPLMDFDLDVLVNWINDIQPDFVNIGADSKNNHLVEPPKEKIEALIKELEKFTEVRIKDNLKRLLE